MSGKILCCGEALIDMLPRQSVDGEDGFAPHAGGAVFNTAIALGRLGVSTGFFTGLSNDRFGQQLQDTLAKSNVDTSACAISERPTTLAFVTLVDGHAQYMFYDENTAGRLLDTSQLPPPVDEVAALHFGAISLISEPCGSAYEALMRREHTTKVVSFDPNIRPNFITDKPAHLARMNRMIAMSDIVKLSDEDLTWFGESGSNEEIALRWRERGPAIVIITRGSEGAEAWGPRGKVSVPGQKVEVADTVGAGDTFNAGILASLSQHELLTKSAISNISEAQLTTALEVAAKAAAITVSRPGANPPWGHEIGFC